MAELASTRVFGTLTVTHGATVEGGKVWHANNHGSGSGLDADTVRGIRPATTAPVWGSEMPAIRNDGVMEIGRYIDFHGVSDEGVDYTVRLDGGIGGSTTLKLTGSLEATGNVTGYSSDVRLKENVVVIKGALDKLNLIRGVTYDWVKECEELGFRPANPHEHGVIAQEVQKVIPDAVAPAPFNNDYLTVRYDRIVPLLIEAIKELRAEVSDLRSAVMEG